MFFFTFEEIAQTIQRGIRHYRFSVLLSGLFSLGVAGLIAFLLGCGLVFWLAVAVSIPPLVLAVALYVYFSGSSPPVKAGV